MYYITKSTIEVKCTERFIKKHFNIAIIVGVLKERHS